MWILSCESECLGGKRTWLRPGSESLLGRTSARNTDGGLRLFIDHKSVSRSHLVLKVHDVAQGDATRMLSVLQIELEDNSKSGTFIDGERLMKDTRTLQPGNYTIKLGKYESAFRLEWRPVVLTFTNLSKAAKARSDALADHREKLEPLGIKMTTDYLPGQSTHVIAKKRNNPASLQALIQGRWLVVQSFVDALSDACKSNAGTDTNGQPYQSRLEKDFDAGWPSEEHWIVPAGDEPGRRPNDYLKPNPARNGIFNGFTFVFLSQAQRDNLLPVISVGDGKAALCQYQLDATTVDDVVRFVANLAGRKDGAYKLSQQSAPVGGIVVVRISERGHGRSDQFMIDLDLALDQRSIEQSEFLDAIVMNDASSLRQPLRDASQSVEPSQRGSRQAPVSNDHEANAAQHSPSELQRDLMPRQQEESEKQPELSPSSKKPARRIITQSRFKGFDDFDPSQIIRVDSDSDSPGPDIKPMASRQRKSEPPRTSDGPEKVLNMQGAHKKRKTPADEAQESEQAMLDELLPGAAALKRRRTEALNTGEKDVFAKPFKDPGTGISQNASKLNAKKSFLEKDIKAEIKKRREKEDAERRKDEEYLQNALDVDISELKNLAKVETFQLPVRESRPPPTNGRCEDWNPTWNGRKNFKKFRPKDNRQANRSNPQFPKVYVALQEVPSRDRGLGDEYWLERSMNEGRTKSKSQSQPLSQINSGATSTGQNDDEEDDGLSFRRRLQRSREEDAYNAEINDLPPGEPPSSTARTSQTLAGESQRKGVGKRPAAQQPPGRPTAKKSRLATARTATSVDDDDDDDPLAFRRKRR